MSIHVFLQYVCPTVKTDIESNIILLDQLKFNTFIIPNNYLHTIVMPLKGEI
jgi:hypothetical protein